MEIRLVQVQQLQPGMRIRIGMGLDRRTGPLRTVDRVVPSGLESSAGPELLNVYYREGRTPEWGEGNSDLPTSLWRVEGPAMVTRGDYAVHLRHAGRSVTVVIEADSGKGAVSAVLAATRAYQCSVEWVRSRPTCDYCNRAATWRTRDGNPPDRLCDPCRTDQYPGPHGELTGFTTQLRVRWWDTVEP